MIYNYKVKDTNGEMASLDEYKGKVLLVVNTATGCGFTPQYEGLQKLYDKYKDRGFEILDFPCNQFFNQAPGDDEEIKSFCTLNYGTTFRRFSKINVNGEGADPVYKYLRTEAPEADEDDKSKKLYETINIGICIFYSIWHFLKKWCICWKYDNFNAKYASYNYYVI